MWAKRVWSLQELNFLGARNALTFCITIILKYVVLSWYAFIYTNTDIGIIIIPICIHIHPQKFIQIQILIPIPIKGYESIFTNTTDTNNWYKGISVDIGIIQRCLDTKDTETETDTGLMILTDTETAFRFRYRYQYHIRLIGICYPYR